MILAIDDLQWGDVDSAILLSDLICSPQSPVLLFIGCFRSEDLERSPFLSEIRKSIAAGPGPLDHRELAVEALTQSEARELTLALLGRDDAVSRAQAHMVGRESGGNPLFIDELVRHIQSGEPTDSWEEIGQLDLDEVLWARIQRQPEEARRLLGVVAVSGRPIRQALAFQATELGAGGRVALASLRSARLIRCIGQTQQDEIETYHDRIRETVVAHLSAGCAALAPRTAGAGAGHRRPGRSGGPRRPPPRCRRLCPRLRILLARGRPGLGGAGVRSRGAALSGRARTAPGGRQPGAAPLEKTGRRTGQRRPRGRGGASLFESGRGSDGRRNPGSQAAGVDPALDQRPRRRRPGTLAHLARPARHDHAPHRAAGPALAPLAPRRCSACAVSVSATATRARSPPWT